MKRFWGEMIRRQEQALKQPVSRDELKREDSESHVHASSAFVRKCKRKEDKR